MRGAPRLLVATVVTLLAVASGCGDGSGACVPGQRACACSALGACADGLDCHQNVCVRPLELTVRVLSPDARACEFVVVDGSTQLTSVRFDNSVQGAFIRRGRRTAVTVIARDDHPIGSGVALAYLPGEAPLALQQSTCFDRQGESLGSSLIEL